MKWLETESLLFDPNILSFDTGFGRKLQKQWDTLTSHFEVIRYIFAWIDPRFTVFCYKGRFIT